MSETVIPHELVFKVHFKKAVEMQNGNFASLENDARDWIRLGGQIAPGYLDKMKNISLGVGECHFVVRCLSPLNGDDLRNEWIVLRGTLIGKPVEEWERMIKEGVVEILAE